MSGDYAGSSGDYDEGPLMGATRGLLDRDGCLTDWKGRRG
jgi:hypothetical protein